MNSSEKGSDLGCVLEKDYIEFLMEQIWTLGKGGMNPKVLAHATGVDAGFIETGITE